MDDTGPPLTLQDRAPPKDRRANVRFLTVFFRDRPGIEYRARYIGEADNDLMLTNRKTRSRRRATAVDMQRLLDQIGVVWKS